MEQKNKYSGLTDAEVAESRVVHGENVLTPPEKESIWKKFLACFNDPIIKILLVALVFSIGIAVYQFGWGGEGSHVFFEPVGILVAVLLATMVGFVLELNNEKTFQSLNEVDDETGVKVIRNGNNMEVPRKDIVVGDIVILETGEEVPADCELLESKNLSVNESSLTGEPVCSKTTDPAQFDKEATYPSNHVLKGTTITEGYCTARVIRVGNETESGKVFKAAQVQEGNPTPLSEKLNWLAEKITTVSYSIAVVIIFGRLILYAVNRSFNLPLFLLYFGISTLLAVGILVLLQKQKQKSLPGDDVPVAKQKKAFNSKLEMWQLGAFIILPSVGFVLYFLLGLHGSAYMLDLVKYLLDTVMLAVTLIIVSVPEGLPMSVTLSLAFSMKKMMKENMLPRTLHACETMGATTVICTDKTGTLTQNQMRVYKFELTGDAAGTGNHYFSDIMAECIAANTTAELDMSNPSRVKPIGNPTEGALLLSLNDGGVDYKQVRNKAVLMDRLPFTTELKYMASLVKSGLSGKTVVYVKGAPEIILEMVAITEEQKQHTLEKLLSYQAKAMRTLAFAYAEVNAKDNVFADGKLAIGGLRFMGFAAISDPVRKEVPDAIRDCIGAGIQVKIVTGDTSATAKEIGRQVGLWEDSDDKNEDAMITGPQFGQTPDEEVKPRLSALKIMSRARPNDKDRLVRMLKARGEVVAVTGDGTNDAPALNAADVGLSMGDGTAVAKEASDMTILDSSFKSIAEAVMWGRSLYKNIQRFITFQMTINVSACLIVLVGAFLGTESPLTVTQILWVNLIMDTFAALALASLPPSKDVLKEKPRKLTDSIISPSMAASIFGVGILFTAGLLALLVYFQHADINSLTGGLPPFGAYDGLNDYEHSLYFTIFVMLQFWNMFNAKAFMTGKSAFKGLGSCTWFIAIAFIILLGQVMIVEFGGAMFNVTPLNGSDWIAIIAGTSIVLWIGEIVRLFTKK